MLLVISFLGLLIVVALDAVVTFMRPESTTQLVGIAVETSLYIVCSFLILGLTTNLTWIQRLEFPTSYNSTFVCLRGESMDISSVLRLVPLLILMGSFWIPLALTGGEYTLQGCQMDPSWGFMDV